MRFARWQCLIAAVALGMGLVIPAHAGPLAVVANFTDPGTRTRPSTGWPPGTVTILDTATDKQVASLTVGANPQAVAITPDGSTAVVACSQSSELYFIDLTTNPPAIAGKLSVGSGQGDTFYPSGLAMSPEGDFVAVTSSVGGESQRSTQTRYLLLVDVKERTLVETVDLQPEGSNLTAEAAAISRKGAIVVVSPTPQPAQIYALPYADGQIIFPDSPENQAIGFTGHPGYNIALTPDGGAAIIPLWTGKLDVATINDAGKLEIVQQLVPSGGEGTHSVAISPDGKLAYVRNLAPPGKITVFEIAPGPSLKSTSVQYNATGFSELLWELQALLGGTAGGWVGSQMIAITPDGKKLYSASPFGSSASGEFDIGNGAVQVFTVGNPNPIAELELGKNPIAVAIQPQ
jgi:YVTN family beta-propeller protein